MIIKTKFESVNLFFHYKFLTKYLLKTGLAETFLNNKPKLKFIKEVPLYALYLLKNMRGSIRPFIMKLDKINSNSL